MSRTFLRYALNCSSVMVAFGFINPPNRFVNGTFRFLINPYAADSGYSATSSLAFSR